MRVIICGSKSQIGKSAGKILCDYVKANPKAVLGFATGASPIPAYNSIAEEYKKGGVSFKEVLTFNLDEYSGMARENKNSYYSFMQENLFSKIDVRPENINFLNGSAENWASECERYSKAIRDAGGIDIQILGIGHNGHIGFNEPGETFSGDAYRVKLTDSTIAANSIYFEDSFMPRYALTMGTKQIMECRHIILIATGEGKAEAVRAMINGKVTPMCPASVLQNHGNVDVFLDEDAAGLTDLG